MEDHFTSAATSWPILLMVVIFYFLLWRPQRNNKKNALTY